MNPHGFGLMDLFGALCLALLIGCAAGLLIGLVGMVLEKLASWSGGLLNRPRRKG